MSKLVLKNNLKIKIITVKKINELWIKKLEKKFKQTFENPIKKDFKKRELLKKFEMFNKLKTIY